MELSDMRPIRSQIFSALELLFLSAFALSILRAPAEACSLAALALRLWFEKMIPSLFPFMILSGLIIRMDFGKLVSLPIYPFLGRLYKIDKTMCTAMLMGFFFGFPLGAKTVAEAYTLGQLSKPKAQYLLSFSNNIGPVYLLSFALPLLGLSGDGSNPSLKAAVAALFFGIPLLYGLALRHTVYRGMAFSAENSSVPASASFSYPKTASAKDAGTGQTTAPLSAASLRKHSPVIPLSGISPRMPAAAPSPGKASLTGQRSIPATPSFLPALDASITSACAAITRLGGYMIFFMVCNLLTEQAAALAKNSAAKTFAAKLAFIAAPILEITSGLSLSKDVLPPALLMTLITFGGLSCFAQTYTCIRDTDLSFGNYCLHKLLQSIIAFCLYTLLFSVFSGRRIS